MAEIDKALPNVRQTINIPSPEEVAVEQQQAQQDIENPKETLPRWEKNKGGRIGLAEGDTPSQAWMRDYFYSSGLDDKGIITLYEFINGPLGWKAYMEHGPGKS